MWNINKIYFIIRILSAIGVVLAMYLLWEQFFRPAFQPCNINNIVNCNAIISGAVAKTFGIPTPLYGLIWYIIIFFAATYKKAKLLLATASFGLIFCLSIGYVELFQLQVICPVCVTCQIIMLTIFILISVLCYTHGKEGDEYV